MLRKEWKKTMDPVTIIDDITSFMIYFVPGYIFWTVYNFLAIRPRESSSEYLIIKSIAASYILNTFFQQVELLLERFCIQKYHTIIVIIASIIGGALCGILRQSNIFAKICREGFKRDFEDDLFFELWRKYKTNSIICIRLRNQETKQIITGQLVRVQEHYKEDPVISLEFYQILQDEGKTIVEDFEHVEGAKISIQYTKDWIIEIVKTISKG